MDTSLYAIVGKYISNVAEFYLTASLRFSDVILAKILRWRSAAVKFRPCCRTCRRRIPVTKDLSPVSELLAPTPVHQRPWPLGRVTTSFGSGRTERPRRPPPACRVGRPTAPSPAPD